MCVIIHLPGNGKNIAKDSLFNAAANNWHGWGLIVKDIDEKKDLEVFYGLPKDGTHTDIDMIHSLLDKHKKKERFLHLRHNTKGDTTEANLHPFLVHDQTYFMHNGTLHQYGNSNNGKSDSLDFVEKILRKTLPHWEGSNGKGDYLDPDFQEMIWKEKWGNNNSRGLLISKHLPPYKAGDWVTFHDKDKNTVFYASNNDYFEKIIRGPVKLQRELEERLLREKKEAENRNNRPFDPENTQSGSSVVSNAYGQGNNILPFDRTRYTRSNALQKEIEQTFLSCNLLEQAGIADLALCTDAEIQAFVDEYIYTNNEVVTALIVFLSTQYNILFHQKEKLEVKAKRQYDMITEFKIQEKSEPVVIDTTVVDQEVEKEIERMERAVG